MQFLFQRLNRSFLFVLFLLISVTSAWAAPTKVACVGDSITAGYLLNNPTLDSYPSRLAGLLGNEWEVRNFGVSGSTLLNISTRPYQGQAAYRLALAYQPDVVIIGLGTNDTKPANFPTRPTQFEPDYLDLIDKFRQANPAVKVYTCLPPPALAPLAGISNTVLVNNVNPAIQNVATQSGATVINLNSALTGRGYCFPDGIHPNELGALLVARTVYQGLTGQQPPPIRKPTSALTIMPLGDSITAGSPVSSGGYRDPLYQLLKVSNNSQFVGSAITGATPALRTAGQDFHEGHADYQLLDLLNNLDANLSDPSKNSNAGYWLSGGKNTDREAVYPNVVLLQAGINDITAGLPLETVQARMTALLDWFATNRPSTRIFVGTLLPYAKSSGYNDTVRAFNDWLTQTIPTRGTNRLKLIDLYSLFVDETGALKTVGSSDGIYLIDGMHPSPAGYQAIAEAWFREVRPIAAGPEPRSLMVNSTEDTVDAYDDQTTLREAILYANTLTEMPTPTPVPGETPTPTPIPTGPPAPAQAQLPTISFDIAVLRGRRTISLNGTALPTITMPMVIESARGVTVDAGGKSDILSVTADNVTLKSLTFAGALNQALQNSGGNLSVSGCTFVGNAGAVSTSNALSLFQCTLTGNRVAVATQGSANVNLAHCTIVGNEVGLQNAGGTGKFNATHCIITNNSQSNTDFPLTSNSFNIISGEAGLDPEGLKNNGGLTDTIALMPGSPAINKGMPGFDGTGQTDQRGGGYARVRTGRIDIGAFEIQNLSPVAKSESYSTLEDTQLRVTADKGVLANDTDPDGNETLRARLVTGPLKGKLTLSSTGAFTYTPLLNSNGTDFFIYEATDGKLSVEARATIIVTPVNDAPTATVTLAPTTPTTTSVLRATPVGSDVDGDRVSFSYVWKNGSTILTDEKSSTLNLAKAGNGDKGNRISVSVTPSDGRLLGATATAAVTVGNTAPTLANTTFKGLEGQVLLSSLPGQDIDKESLHYSPVKAPRFGKLVLKSNGTFAYTPGAKWNGTDSFTATVSDGSKATATATFTLVIAPVNGPPVAVNDSLEGSEDVPLTISAATLLKNDNNGELPGEIDPLKIIAVAVPTGFPGTLKLDVAKQTILFTPQLNWNGTTSFTYTVQDSGKATATATVTLKIAPVNDAPVALPTRLTVLSGMMGEVALAGTDVEGSPLTFALNSRPSNGGAQLVQVGKQWLVRYQSRQGFSGTDTLSFVVYDGQLKSQPATVTITVTPNIAPQLVSLSPARGTIAAGSSLVFEQRVRDANGTAHLSAAALLIGNSLTAANARGGATLWFDAQNNRFTMTGDSGTGSFPPVALGQTLENSQVKVTLGASDVTRDSSGILTLRWRVTFNPGFTGTKSLWARVEDLGAMSAGFTKQGELTLTAPSTSTKLSAPNS